MSTLICYEAWNKIDDRNAAAAKLIDLALRVSPSLRTCRVTIAGRGSERSCSIERIPEIVKDIDASWSVTILDPVRRIKGAPFLISEAYFTLRMGREPRGFYLYGGGADSLIENVKARSDFLSEVAGFLGDGFGYCAQFANPNEATNYSLDLRIAASDKQLVHLLTSKAKTWSDVFSSTAVENCVPRDLFPLNIWPTSYVARIKADRIYECLLSEGAEFTELKNARFIVAVPESGLGQNRACLSGYIFEGPPKTLQ